MNTDEIYYDDPVSRACANGNIEEFRKQLANGADINQVDKSRILVKSDMSDFKNAKEIYKIIESKGLSTQFLTPIGIALRARNKELLEFILNNGGDINKAYHAAAITLGEEDDVILSGFEFAIRSGYYEGMQIIEDRQGTIGLNQERVDALLFHALPRARHIHGLNSESAQDILTQAREKDFHLINDGIAIMSHLIDRYGANINALNPQGFSLLHCADKRINTFYGDDGRVVRYLLMRGCDPNIHIDRKKFKPLKISFSDQFKDQLSEMGGSDLFSYLTDPNIQLRQEMFNTTPLIYGCYNGDTEFVKILLENERTNPILIDMNGNDALVAFIWGRKDNCFGDEEKFNAIEAALSKAIKAKTGLNITFPSVGTRPS